MFIFESMIVMLAHATPSKELALKFWTIISLTSSLFMVACAVKSKLVMKLSQKEAWSAQKYSKAYSTFRSREDYSGNQFSSQDCSGNQFSGNHGQGKKKKPGKVPRWINFAFICIDAFLNAVHHGTSWLFGRKTTTKKSSSKSARHKVKLAKCKAKKGHHYKRYWGCTKEAKFKVRQAAIAANMHWSTSYWQSKAREERAEAAA
jgi:hypothetical protein